MSATTQTSTPDAGLRLAGVVNAQDSRFGGYLD